MKDQLGLFGGVSTNRRRSVRVRSTTRRLASGRTVSVSGYSQERTAGHHRAPSRKTSSSTPSPEQPGLFGRIRIQKKIPKPKGYLWKTYGDRGGPAEVQGKPPPHERSWGGRPPHELAKDMLGAARRLLVDPDAGPVLADPETMTPDDREDLYAGLWTPDDLPDLLGVPGHGRDGEPLTADARYRIARAVTDLAIEEHMMGAGGWTYTSPSRSFQPVATGNMEAMQSWLTEAIVTDALNHDRKSRLKRLDKRTTARFIKKHHSSLPTMNPRGLMYAVGLVNGGRLAAVATVNSPGGRWGQGDSARKIPVDRPLDAVDPRDFDAEGYPLDVTEYDEETGAPLDGHRLEVTPLDVHNVVELTRVASDGTVKGASSMLAARMIKLAPKSLRGDTSGPWLFVTYSLTTETGSTYKALRELGLRPVLRTPGKKGTAGGGGSRSVGADAQAQADKVRWEAGPAALHADWSLLD